MREIKFRGKSIETGEWVYGMLFANLDPHKKENTWVDVSIYRGLRNIESPIPVHPETIGQFTGLLDKNGKQIYEGDVLCPTKPAYAEENREVKFVEGSFCYSMSKKMYPKIKYCSLNKNVAKLFELIGNVYQNPELINP